MGDSAELERIKGGDKELNRAASTLHVEIEGVA
jgi:hypothetical protein